MVCLRRIAINRMNRPQVNRHTCQRLSLIRKNTRPDARQHGCAAQTGFIHARNFNHPPGDVGFGLQPKRVFCAAAHRAYRFDGLTQHALEGGEVVAQPKTGRLHHGLQNIAFGVGNR
jgi:hypothetical protein